MARPSVPDASHLIARPHGRAVTQAAPLPLLLPWGELLVLCVVGLFLVVF